MGVPDRDRCPLMPTYNPPRVQFVRGEGSWLWDREDRRYLDFLSGLAVTSLGHAHPEVAEALATQAQKLLHVSNLFGTEHNWAVASHLDRLIGGGGQVFFCNSGAEANEAAFKLARKFGGHGRHKVISAFASFHGRTMAALAATGQPSKQEPFQPLPEGFVHAAWGEIDELDRMVDATVAAVHLEPIQGEGGVNVPPPGYLAEVQRLCRERGALFMVDEVQTGLGRTGRWMAHHHEGLEPDVVCMAKALGNGVPIGACWARDEVAAAFSPGDHATTYGGQPLATAAARRVLEVMEREDVCGRAERAGARLTEQLSALDAVKSVRGRGLLLAAELGPGADAKALVATALDEGLVANAITPTAVRFAPSLLVTDAEIDRAVEIFAGVVGS